MDFSDVYNSNTVGMSTLLGQYRDGFTDAEWARVVLFETHFDRELDDSKEYSYAELVDKRWKFLEKLTSATETAKMCCNYAQSYAA